MAGLSIGEMAVEARTVNTTGGAVTELVPGTPLWHVVQAIGEQVVQALDDLGFVRTDGFGQTHGFNIKDLAITADGARVVIQLDVTSIRQIYRPTARNQQQRGKPIAFLSLTSERVLEQIRIRISDMLGGKVDVWIDNHFWVRWVADLSSLDPEAQGFSGGDLVDHLEAIPTPYTLPLGLDRRGELRLLDLVAQPRHTLITGRSGFGKTTWIDGAILSLIYHTDPQRHPLNLVFLDPQRVNFSPYAGLEADYQFVDREGALTVAWQPEEIVSAMVRLNQEHLRRVHLIGDTPWASIEGYNDHVSPEQRLPYVCVFIEEAAVLREVVESQLGRDSWRVFESNLRSLIVGGRKVGFRVFIALQYLKGSVIPPEIAAQTGIVLAFWNSPQGSKNTLGDSAASQMTEPGRFVVDGLPGESSGRVVLQGLYVDRSTVLDLLDVGRERFAFPVDGMVVEVLNYALEQLGGKLSYDDLGVAFDHLMSRRQMGNFLHALEGIGLAHPTDRSRVPPAPRRLAVESLQEAVEVLQYHPEITFREVLADDGVTLVFGPESAVSG